MDSKTYFSKKNDFNFDDLTTIMHLLRAPDGCPWDREQTHTSIRQNFLEEAYEACDAIDQNDPKALCEELGDVLMQVVFHAEIAKDEGEFMIEDVINGLCRKLIVRHPHVFGEISVADSKEVLDNWESIKNDTKGFHTLADTLNGVALALPALMRAQKLVSRTKKQGLDPTQFLTEGQNPETELGRRLFLIAMEAKEQGLDAENALDKYNKLYFDAATSKK